MEKKDYRPSDTRAAEAFEGKMYEELTPNQQDFVRFLFGNPFEKRFHCALCDDYEKADFYLECDDLRRYVSLKGGRTDTVHHEHIKRFILF